jgi:hypothetical protein
MAARAKSMTLYDNNGECDVVSSLDTAGAASLSNSDIVAGLKEALDNATVITLLYFRSSTSSASI